MVTEPIAGTHRFLRRPLVVAVAVLVTAAALAGSGGRAVAAPHPRGAAATHRAGRAGIISTVAGGVGGPARATKVALGIHPCGVSFGAGHLYVTDNLAVRRVNPQTDRLITPAGTGTLGRAPRIVNGTPAAALTLVTCGATTDHAGNLLVADYSASEIGVVAASKGRFYGRRMNPGDIYAVAGGGTARPGDGGPATRAALNVPNNVAVDRAGNLVIADTDNNRIRVVAASTGTFYGQAMTAGDIYTVAGNGQAGFSGDGGPAASGEVDFPAGVAVDGAGNLVLADTGNNRIRVAADTTGTFYGQAMTAGDIYTVAGNGQAGFSGDGGAATSAELNGPVNAVPDGAGNLVLADSTNNRVRVVAASTGTFYGQAMQAGDIYTVAGDGATGFAGDRGPATSAATSVFGVTVDGAGNLVIADGLNLRVRVVAASTGTFYRKPMTAGDIYTAAGNGIPFYSGDGRPATTANINRPYGVTVAGAGSLVITDSGSNRIRVVAGTRGRFYGQAMTAGDIYTVAGNGQAGFSGDGGPGTAAALSQPQGVAADRAGNLVIADSRNNRIRVVADTAGRFYGRAMLAGHIYTVAGDGTEGFSGDGGPAVRAAVRFPFGVAVDRAGNLVIADTDNNRIRVVADATGRFYGQAMTAGDIYTVAGDGTERFSGDGGPAVKAALSGPVDVAMDGPGNLVISDNSNARVRVVAAGSGRFYGQQMTAGDIYTVAGDGTFGFSGDGGPARKAGLGPEGLAVDRAGNLVIADASSRIRAVAVRTGGFYGQAMTAGDIYTVAGDGNFRFSGDGGPAARASLYFPSDVAVDHAGNLLITDTVNDRIRLVTG